MGSQIEAQPLSYGRSSIPLFWTAPGDDDTTGTASTYELRYSTDSVLLTDNFSQATLATGVASPKLAKGDESYVVTNLASETVYFLALRTGDEAGNWSPVSNLLKSPRTDDQFPPAAIDDLAAEPGPLDGDLNISWSAVGDDSLTGTAVSYTIKLSSSVIDDANWDQATTAANAPVPGEPGTAQTLSFPGLNPGQQYYVAIKAEDNYGNLSDLSNVAIGEAAVDLTTGTGAGDLPLDYSLSQNYPNPFNPATTVRYSVPATTHVRLIIYNALGQVITTLVDGLKQPGHHSSTWEGTSTDGSQVASGIYLYRLETGTYVQTRKMILLK